jgi:hypothetical protein
MVTTKTARLRHGYAATLAAVAAAIGWAFTIYKR